MAFPPSFIDELVARNPIEDVVGHYVSLKRSGGNLFGLCPFHGEKTASFSVNPDKGIYYCFGCHKGGGVINFQMEIEGLSYPDAVRALAKRVGMQVPEDEQYQSRYKAQERLWALSKEAARFFHSQLYAPSGAEGLAYAQKRGMPKAVLTKFGVGFAPDSWSALKDAMLKKGYTEQELKDAGLVSEKGSRTYDKFRNRLMFPIIDVRGNVIGFGGRVMDDSTPKYLNSPETLIFNKRKNLFALNLAKKSKLGYLILVEGYMDAVALHQYGFDCAVASLGTSLTEEHAALLTRYTDQVVLIYDGDEAGQRATRRAIPILEKAGLQVKVLKMRDAKDPDEFLKKFGADKFKLLLEDASNRVEYQLNAIRRKYDLREDGQRIQFVQECADLIGTLSSSAQRYVYGNRIAEEAKITQQAMEIEIRKSHDRREKKQKREEEKRVLEAARNVQPKSRTIRYDDVKSARAEEGLIAMAMREPALLDLAANLKAEEFSVPLFANVYTQMQTRHLTGLGVSVAALEDLDSDQASHIAMIAQSMSGPVNEQAFRDYVDIIHARCRKRSVSSDEDLLALRNRKKESGGYHG